jgi:hypothetical protein
MQEVNVGVRSPFCLCSEVKMREGAKGSSVVKTHHLTISLQHLLPIYFQCHPNCLISTLVFWRTVLSLCKMAVPYPGYRSMRYTWRMNGGENAILFTLWRQNEGGTKRNFSRKHAPLHYFTAAVTSYIYLQCHPNCLISPHVFWCTVSFF